MTIQSCSESGGIRRHITENRRPVDTKSYLATRRATRVRSTAHRSGIPWAPPSRNFFGSVPVRTLGPNRHIFIQHAWSLPDRLDSGGLEAAVASYERKAEVEGRCGDDTVGHVGNNVARNILERVGYPAIQGGDEQS